MRHVLHQVLPALIPPAACLQEPWTCTDGCGLVQADAEGGRLQHLAVSDVMAPALLALYNRACCQVRPREAVAATRCGIVGAAAYGCMLCRS